MNEKEKLKLDSHKTTCCEALPTEILGYNTVIQKCYSKKHRKRLENKRTDPPCQWKLTMPEAHENTFLDLVFEIKPCIVCEIKFGERKHRMSDNWDSKIRRKREIEIGSSSALTLSWRNWIRLLCSWAPFVHHQPFCYSRSSKTAAIRKVLEESLQTLDAAERRALHCGYRFSFLQAIKCVKGSRPPSWLK